MSPIGWWYPQQCREPCKSLPCSQASESAEQELWLWGCRCPLHQRCLRCSLGPARSPSPHTRGRSQAGLGATGLRAGAQATTWGTKPAAVS